MTFAAYVRQDPIAIADRPREVYQDEQKRTREHARAAIIARRSSEAIRTHLESLLRRLPDEEKRVRIGECLARNNPEEMKAVIQEIKGQAEQRSPEDKLTELLDSLKEYCSDEELDGYCSQAFQVLAESGFRDARTFVVNTHDQLRTRLKELEEQKVIATE